MIQSVTQRNSNNEFGMNVVKADKVAFKGAFMNVATTTLQTLDKYPMLNVSALDTVTAIAPRTALDARTNGFAAFETFRRESSGLLVNCLLPSFIVLGVAKSLEGLVFGDKAKKVNMAGVWANEHSIKELSAFYKNSKGETKTERVANYVASVLKNVDAVKGTKEISYADKSYHLDKAVKILTDTIMDDKKSVKKGVSGAYESIITQTRAGEIIKINKKPFDSNLSGLLDNVVQLGRRFKLDEVGSNLKDFNFKSVKLVNAKSILGMAIILPLAVSMQSINRAITKRISGVEGAPIYKDFGKTEKIKEINEKEKKELRRNKVIAVGAMLGVALASMAKMPTMGMFQFKGIFPTMDQCRWISAATFASRMAVAEDKNELRESAIRDVATFASFYWLGDYASKLAATAFEKINKKVQLLNNSKPLDKNATKTQKVINWISSVHLKSYEEVADNVKVKNLRTACQLTGFAFSTVLLGLLIPWYTRKQTERNERLARSIHNHQLRIRQPFQEVPPAFKNFIT